MLRQRQDPSLWLAFANCPTNAALFFFFFFSACIVINSATVRGPRGVSKVETQRLALSEITSRAEVLKRLRQPLQT